MTDSKKRTFNRDLDALMRAGIRSEEHRRALMVGVFAQLEGLLVPLGWRVGKHESNSLFAEPDDGVTHAGSWAKVRVCLAHGTVIAKVTGYFKSPGQDGCAVSNEYDVSLVTSTDVAKRAREMAARVGVQEKTE